MTDTSIIKSDLNVDIWERELNSLNHESETKFLLDGIQHGFKITNVKKDIKPVKVDNYKSALDNSEAVEKQILTEIEEGRYLIVESPPEVISGLGAIPKDDGSVRLIHDCSRPVGDAVNDHAVLDYNIKYQTVQDACELLEEGAYMAKVDLKSAYRSVAIHPSQYKFTGLQWTFSVEKQPTYLIDTRLPFGARLSPSHFHRLSQAFKQMLEKRHIKAVTYLDDIFITAPTLEECKDHLNLVIALLRELGFAIAWKKIAGPSQTMTFLGIEINSCTMKISLPQEKVSAYSILLEEFLHRSRASIRQLQRLAGIISFASHVVTCGSPYRRQCYDLLRSARRPHHKVLLHQDFKDDIKWWIAILRHTNSAPIRKKACPKVTVFTDASQNAGGMMCHNDWVYLDWNTDLTNMSSKHINVKETMAVVGAVYRWARDWENKAVIVYTDNMTARAAINEGRSNDKEVLLHIRNVFWIAHMFNFSIKCEHIRGSANIHADAVSRLSQKGHLMFWLSCLANGRSYSLYDVFVWFRDHMSLTSCASLLSQVQKKIPWLKHSTERYRNTEV